MKTLNIYINEAWSGVKKHTNNAEIEAWCEEMGVENYTINSKGEIDVSKSVYLSKMEFKELPYKFGKVDGCFDLEYNKNLISLKNCPNEVEGYFSCSFCSQLDSLKGCPKEVKGNFNCSSCRQLNSLEGCPQEVKGSFNCSGCPKLDSLKGCPKEVEDRFLCSDCKRKFTTQEVKSLCKVKGEIYI